MIRKVLALLMTLSLLPFAAWAQEEGTAEEPMVFPAFEAENLLDAEHRVTEAIFQEADLTLLNYWASWCGPCAEELPDLGELSALSEGRVQVVGVLLDGLTVSKDGESTERNEQEIEDALALMADAKAEYPLLMPEGFLGMLSSVITAVPTTFLINRDGELLGAVSGARSAEEWLELANSLLAEAETEMEAETETETEAETEAEAT